MSYEKWMGTDQSLIDLQNLEAEVAELRKAAAANGDRQAFFFLDDQEDSQDDNRMGAHLIERVGEVAVIRVGGSLVNNHDSYHRYFPGRVTSYEAIIGATSILQHDETVKRVVLRVGSSGGAVTGVSRAAEAIRKLDGVKPVTSHVETHAFSAGYWLAAAGREVVAGDPMAEFGSIGTLLVQMSRNRMLEDNGIDAKIFRAGEFKAVGHPAEALTDIGQKYLQADVEKANNFFLEHISKRRNVSIGAKEVWAEGKTFFAIEAQSVGLVDRVEALDDLLVRFSGAQNHHNRSYGMNLSPEKLARIEAGACPKDVLSADELKQYQAEAEEAAKTAEVTTDEEATKTAEAEEAAAAKKAAESSTIDASLSDLLKENGRLEARLEARDEQLADLKGKLTAQEATFGSLMAIAVDAVNNREMALGKPKTDPSTPEGLVSAYHTLSTEMSARFNTGQRSASTPTREEEAQVTGIPRRLQVRRQGVN